MLVHRNYAAIVFALNQTGIGLILVVKMNLRLFGSHDETSHWCTIFHSSNPLSIHRFNLSFLMRLLCICTQPFLFSLHAVLPPWYPDIRLIPPLSFEPFVFFEGSTDCSGSNSRVAVIGEDVSPGECHDGWRRLTMGLEGCLTLTWGCWIELPMMFASRSEIFRVAG